jgi:ParB family chromosome partitioning protein
MEKVALEQVIVSNPYLRTHTDIDSLKKSIEAIGLINPLTVNEKNELLAGGRRYQALKELGYSEVSVNRVERSSLEQELISIDENLVRTPLSKIEFENCLNRGREIYEELNPSALKVETKVKPMSPAEKKIEKEQDETDTTSFAAVTSAKTGLSKAVIKKAIQRDASSSDLVKQARSAGEVSASQVNEIIQLEKEDQDKILEHVKDKPVKDVRKIVKAARARGLESAIEESQNTEVIPREFSQLEAQAKKTNKLLTKIIVENMHTDSDQIKNVIKQIHSLSNQSKNFLELFGEEVDFMPPNSDSYEESATIQ